MPSGCCTWKRTFSLLTLEPEVQERTESAADHIADSRQEAQDNKHIFPHVPGSRLLQRCLQLFPERNGKDDADDQAEPVLPVHHKHHVRPVIPRGNEHPPDISECRHQTVSPEEHPADQNNKDCVKMLEEAWDSLQASAESDTLKNEKNGIIQAPYQEVETCAMPQPCCSKDNQEIDVGAHRAFSVAAQRNIQVIPEPGAQGNMPSPPEFANRFGNIRKLEVFQKVKSEQFAQTDRHVRVTAEIIVNLQRIGDDAQPVQSDRRIVAFKHGIHEERQLISNENLLCKSLCKANQPRCHFLQGYLPPVDL